MEIDEVMKKIYCIVILLLSVVIGLAAPVNVTVTVSVKIGGQNPGTVDLASANFIWEASCDRLITGGCPVINESTKYVVSAWSGTKGAVRLSFSTKGFTTCNPNGMQLNDNLKVKMTINAPGTKYDKLVGTVEKVIGRANSFSITLDFEEPKPTIKVTDKAFCQGTTNNTITATISNVPADFRMEEYRLDWGDNRIVTSDVSVTGNVATVTGIVKEELTETVEGLFPRLLKDSVVLVVAEDPYSITVKEAAIVSLRAELAGKVAGDEVFFEVADDGWQENLTCRWYVNAEPVAGRLDWFASRLQEGDIVKCGVTGVCPGEVFSNEITVHFADVWEEKWNDRSAEDNGGFRIPNVLTPNDDGVNDVWKLDFLQDYSDHLITIYDYAGKVVYQTRHYRNDWGGKVNEVLTYGVYTCVINLGNKKTLKTWLDVRTNNK